MSQLIAEPRLSHADANGVPYSGALLNTYVSKTSDPAVTWRDSTLQNAHPNPVVADDNGRFPVIYGADDVVYKFVITDRFGGNPASPMDPVSSFILTQTAVANALTPLTDTEASLGITAVNSLYPVGDVQRYLPALDGSTDDTAALLNWAKVGGNLSFPAKTAVVSQSIPLLSNTTVTFAEGATLKCATADISPLLATNQTRITIRGGKVQQTVAGAAAHIGLVKLDNCTYCTVDGMELVGHQWAGILLSDSSSCEVRRNRIHDALGNGGNTDQADICVYRASSYNKIKDNTCYGGLLSQHGIMILDPGGSAIPTKDEVAGNNVGPHSSYGIVQYLADHANTYSSIGPNNVVEGITGTDLGGSAGAGIYNQGGGGTAIFGNHVRNCCISTTNNTLLPAGIAINCDPTLEPCNVFGNTISDMANFYYIEVVSGPCNIYGNTISAVSGAANIGIYANLASNVSITDNVINMSTSIANGTGIFVFANGGSISDIVVSDNKIKGTSLRGIRVDTTGAPTITTCAVNGNIISGGGSASVPLQLGNIILGAVSGNIASATTTNALSIAACTQTRFTGNVLTTTGTQAVVTNGVCTGSYFDKSNYSNTDIVNAATGLIVEQLASATPLTGFNSAVGDRREQSVPVVGNPKGWRCTVAGNSGTWVSEGVL